MKEKIVFKREEAFKEWLVNNGVKSTPKSYASYIRTIQNYLNVDIDELLSKGLQDALEKINFQNIPLANKSISSYRVALNRYSEFINSSK